MTTARYSTLYTIPDPWILTLKRGRVKKENEEEEKRENEEEEDEEV